MSLVTIAVVAVAYVGFLAFVLVLLTAAKRADEDAEADVERERRAREGDRFPLTKVPVRFVRAPYRRADAEVRENEVPTTGARSRARR